MVRYPKKSKKFVKILTIKPVSNYGGILQAYALKKVLTDFSAEVTVGYYEKSFTRTKQILGYVKRLTHRYLLRNENVSDVLPSADRFVSAQTRKFVDEYLNVHGLDDDSRLRLIVVGSDQVWRNSYVPVEKYLLGSVKATSLKKISYAASFGRDDLDEYGPALISRSAKLAQQFDAISVREDSAVDIVKKHWGLRSVQHVDPTLLLSSREYERLIDKNKIDTSVVAGDLFAYILDENEIKKSVIRFVAETLPLKPFQIMPPKAISSKAFRASPEKYQLPPVVQWLKSFRDAKFVVTDSFHGVVFSIIFHKPFIAIGNKARGLTRFTSLLKMFGLENRLIFSIENLDEDLLKAEIDWKKVDNIIKIERERSLGYLKEHLK